MPTSSEDLITHINQGIFYKEFTFDKNEFYPSAGEQKELADNILLLDDLFFIIQIKERNKEDVKTAEEENKWFNNVVLKKAKNQIKSSVEFFGSYDRIAIKNRREQTIDISKANVQNANKLIIYVPNSSLISETNRFLKFYESREVGNIHIFDVEDYYWICKYLVTPAELDEYLKFRERFYVAHNIIANELPEQYVLAHFLNTDDERMINEIYITTLTKLLNDREEYDMSHYLSNFWEKIHLQEQKLTTDYHQIIKEIAKLRRYELIEFKKRFQLIIEKVKDNEFSLPYRFASLHTQCGFVFIPLAAQDVEYWENALLNSTEIYKYKRKLDKCLGVIAYKKEHYFDIYWAYIEHQWVYNEELENDVNNEIGYQDTTLKLVERYKF